MIQETRGGEERSVQTSTATSFEAALIFVKALESIIRAGLARDEWEVSVSRREDGRLHVRITTEHQP